MTTVSAMRIVQKGLGAKGQEVPIYVTALTLGQLRTHSNIDAYSPVNTSGYQRPPVDRRIRELAQYILQEQGILPTSVLLAARPGDKGESELSFNSELNAPVSVGVLTIPDAHKLWLVDGQHRFFGVNRAFENNGREELIDYPFPVSIMDGIRQYDEMVHFNIVNTRQRKMPTDIVDRHLVQQQEHEGLGMVASGGRGERAYHQATATRITDLLNEAPGPWYHQIAIPGVSGRDQGLIRQHAIVASLGPVLRDTWVNSLNPLDQHVVQLLTDYWGALAEVWEDAFNEPSRHRVQATVGVYSLHMVLPVLLQRCLSESDFSKKKMADLIAATGISASFWHKDLGKGGDPLTLGTGMASIRALAYYIIGELPKTTILPVRA